MVPAFLFEKKLAQAAAQQMRSPTGRSPPCPPVPPLLFSQLCSPTGLFGTIYANHFFDLNNILSSSQRIPCRRERLLVGTEYRNNAAARNVRHLIHISPGPPWGRDIYWLNQKASLFLRFAGAGPHNVDPDGFFFCVRELLLIFFSIVDCRF